MQIVLRDKDQVAEVLAEAVWRAWNNSETLSMGTDRPAATKQEVWAAWQENPHVVLSRPILLPVTIHDNKIRIQSGLEPRAPWATKFPTFESLFARVLRDLNIPNRQFNPQQ